MSDGVFMRAPKILSMFALAGGVLIGCAQLKEAGRTIGHTTRDVTRAIGHGTREVVNDVGDGIRDTTNSASEEVKKAVKPSSSPSEY
jgi:hypothetical protein